MKNKTTALMMTGMLAASLMMFGCGGQASSSSAKTEQKTQVEQTTPATEQKSTSAAESTTQTQTQPTQTTSTQTTTQTAAQISVEDAKQIALKDAGLTEAGVTELKAELDKDSATPHYDVDFKAGGMEHDYDIDITTGAILSHTTEVDD